MPVIDHAAVEELRRRLERFPPDRYPVQHATTQFHLGMVLLGGDQPQEAAAALRSSVALFAPEHLPTEHAKASNLLGAALRAIGDHTGAVAAFRRAAALFDAQDLPLERAAARFNLGLAHRDAGDDAAAVECFVAASETFASADVPAQAAAAARELGALLLDLGDVDAAVRQLELAVQHADRAGDLVSRGVALNALGLAYVAAQRLHEARRTFEQAVEAHPRSVRPEFHAMAKLNLALAAEAIGDLPTARLAGRQALGVAAAPAAVTDQASELLGRVGDDVEAVHEVLDQEPADRWTGVLRDELVWWVQAPDEDRRRLAGGWIDGLVARPAQAEARAASWLAVLLELPPHDMHLLIRDTLRALGEHDTPTRERFADPIERSMAMFGLPQFLRLKDLFNTIAEDLGQEPTWG